MKTANSHLIYTLLLPLVVLINATGLFSSVMETDGALYAYIAKQMAQHNDFINLYNNTDWLDKPHFPFWVTAISFRLFGINSFAYKFPAFLFWLTGLVYLYKIGKKLYNRQTATIAVLIYATALQAVVGLFDVRAEHYLTALAIAAIYYLYRLYETNRLKYVWAAALFSACAVMTKGIFFLATIVAGQGLLVLIKKEWRQFSNYKWYLYLGVTFLFTLPELYTLYVQFDLHPEKVVYGKTGVSGLKFFFWDSQFGRFLNTGPIKGKGDPLFFFHTTLWAFLPWSILLFTSVARLIREKVLSHHPVQWIVAGSAGFTFFIFSLSKFQLPHYIIVLFPHFALLSADYLVSRQRLKGIRSFVLIQCVMLVVLVLGMAGLSAIFRLPHYEPILIGAAFVAGCFLYLSRGGHLSSVLYSGIGFSVILTLYLNLFFYPALLRYQSGEVAAKWMNQNRKPAIIGSLKIESPGLKFYADSKVIATDALFISSSQHLAGEYYFARKKVADSLVEAGLPVATLQAFPDFHISTLTFRFLNAKTRASQLDTTVLFILKK